MTDFLCGKKKDEAEFGVGGLVSSDFGLRGSLAVRQNRGEGMDGDGCITRLLALAFIFDCADFRK